MVETYLRARAITLPVPPSIRHIADLRHAPTGHVLNAMIAGLQSPQGEVRGVQRTYLRTDGCGKADVTDPKMSLGSVPGGAVRLAAAGAVLGLAEGVETGLSAMQLFSLPVWCALGSRLAQVALPRGSQRIIIFADTGDAGRQAAQKAANALSKQKRQVTIKSPPEGFGDWNDVLVAEARKAA